MSTPQYDSCTDWYGRGFVTPDPHAMMEGVRSPGEYWLAVAPSSQPVTWGKAQGVGYRMQESRFRAQDTGCRTQFAGHTMHGV